MAYWYISSIGNTNVATWQASHAYSVGNIVRPTTANGFCYICTAAGTSATTEGSWAITKGATKTSGTATFREATGYPALNGDSTNTVAWAASVARLAGDIIKNISGGADTYFICTTAGTSKSGAEPSWNKAAGATTADGTATWTSLGAISNYTAIWASPHGRIVSADNWGVDGDTFYISNNHAETSNTTTVLLATGIATAPSTYLCVNDSLAPPNTLATTATITTTNNPSPINLGNTPSSVNYAYGLNIIAGSGGANAGAIIRMQGLGMWFDNCSFYIASTSGTPTINIGESSRPYNINIFNSTFQFNAAGQCIALAAGSNSGLCNIVGGAAAATGTAPTTLFKLASSANLVELTVRDCDLSAISGNLFDTTTGSVGNPTSIYVENCKINGSVTFDVNSLLNPASPSLHIHNCDSTNTNYRFYTRTYMGISQQETTTTRNGGASDGITPISWNLTSSSDANYAFPFQSEEIAIWNEAVGSSLTAIIEIASSTSLNTTDIWIEFEYAGSASWPIGSINITKGNPLVNAAVPTSAASWNSSPGSTQKLTATFTPQMKGIIKARVYLAKPSTTVYVDPYIQLSNNVANRRQYLLPGFGGMNETAQGEFSYTFVS